MSLASGSFQTNNNSARVNEGWGLRVEWEQLEGGYTVRTRVFLEFRESWADLRLSNSRTGTITVNGSSSNISFNSGDYAAGKRDYQIGSSTVNIGGTGNFVISVSLPVEWTLRGESVTGFSGSRTVSLNSIGEAPNTPTSPTLSSSGTSLSFAWGHTATTTRPVNRFRVERRVGSGSYSFVENTTTRSSSGTGVRGSSYTYRVRAENDFGSSNWATSNSEAIPYLAANAPTDVKVSVSETTLSVSWSHTETTARPINSTNSFTVQWKKDNGDWAELGHTVSKSITRAGERGASYQFRIRANGPGGNSSWATSGTGSVDFANPAAPVLTVSEGSTEKVVSIRWTYTTSADTPITGFSIEKRVDGGAWQSFGSPAQGSRSTTDSGLSRGTVYEYRIKATANQGDSSWSNIAGTRFPYVAPGAPNLSGSRSGTTANLSWTSTETEDAPVVSYALTRDGSAIYNSSGLSWSDAGRSRGTSYTYRVKAIGMEEAGDSGWSNAVSLYFPYLPPYMPANLNVERIAHNHFRLKWTQQRDEANRPVFTYRIYRKADGGNYLLLEPEHPGSQTQYEDRNIALGTTYQYYIVAVNPDEETASGSSNLLTNPAGLPVYNGSQWLIHPVYSYDGSAWQHREVHGYDGSKWHWRG